MVLIVLKCQELKRIQTREHKQYPLMLRRTPREMQGGCVRGCLENGGPGWGRGKVG